MGRGAIEAKQGCVSTFEHAGRRVDFNRAAVPGIGNEVPDSRRSGFKRHKVSEVQWGDKSVGIDPNTQALGENMAIGW